MNRSLSPIVSVVLPTYEREDLLIVALRSVLAQTFNAFEVLVCDDANSPRIRTLVESLNDRRFQYIGNPIRLGMLANNVNGFGLAAAPFIANLHDDDRWAADFLDRLTRPLLDDASVSIAFCNQNVIDEFGRPRSDLSKRLSIDYGRARLSVGKYSNPQALVVAQTIPAVAGSVFRKTAVNLGHFYDAIGPAYDLWLSYLATRSGAAYFVGDALIDYRIHSNSQTGTGGIAWSLGTACCWQRIADDPKYVALKARCRRKMGRALTQTAATLLGTSAVQAAERPSRYAWQGFKECPNPQSAAVLAASFLPIGLAKLMRRAWRSRHRPLTALRPPVDARMRTKP